MFWGNVTIVQSELHNYASTLEIFVMTLEIESFEAFVFYPETNEKRSIPLVVNLLGGTDAIGNSWSTHSLLIW